MEGFAALHLWELILDVFANGKSNDAKIFKNAQHNWQNTGCPITDTLLNVDYVQPNMPLSQGKGTMIIFEDNEAVIKMCVKSRAPQFRHVPRTHRVDLDWLFERLCEDPSVFIKYVGTKEQLADILTKGSFTNDAWKKLCHLAQIGPVLKGEGREQ